MPEVKEEQFQLYCSSRTERLRVEKLIFGCQSITNITARVESKHSHNISISVADVLTFQGTSRHDRSLTISGHSAKSRWRHSS